MSASSWSFYGIIYAILENDMRRILAYSIVNQVGFMVAGVGIGTEMALNGAAAHAFTHIIYKALLLMSAGSVLYMTGKRKCTDLGGLFRTMPLTTICGIVGALAISSFPLTSGFVSKSMISDAAADQHLALVWFLLAAASAGVFLHAGIKFPWFVFFQKDFGLRPPDPPWNMRLAMIFFAALCIGLGVLPGPLYAMLPYPVDFVPYTAPRRLPAAAAAVLRARLLPAARLAEADADDHARHRLVLSTAWTQPGERLRRPTGRAWQWLVGAFGSGAKRINDRLHRHHGPEGVLGRTWPTGTMAFWTTVMLAAYLILANL